MSLGAHLDARIASSIRSKSTTTKITELVETSCFNGLVYVVSVRIFF
jgi:hypothetical protein